MSAKDAVKKYIKKIKGVTGSSVAAPVETADAHVPQDIPSREIPAQSEEVDTLAEVIAEYRDKDRDKVWAFVAGQYSQDFRGNPKYLFMYINNYRPDITAYWLCSDEETLAQVRGLGCRAYAPETPEAQYVIDHTGVLVAEQVKDNIPKGFENVKYLNLYHGVGVKRVERKLFLGDIAMELAKKYITRGSFYRDHQLFTVTSPTIEREYREDCGLEDKNLVKTGYLRCLYQQNFKPVVTFEHDLRKQKGLPEDTRLVVYAPTYRAKLGNTFATAVTDLESLYQCCERNQILLIFKVHPQMEKEVGFLKAGELYGDRPYFWFWDNRNDFYEIMDQMDLAIVDYSGIVADMVAVGIRHFIRYVYDLDEYMQDGLTQGEYFERTLGKICYTQEELIAALDAFELTEEPEEIAKIQNKFWTYSQGKEDFERTIEAVFDFQIAERDFPNLYSFDVFDTLISRKVLEPEGIFYDVREKMMQSGDFPMALVLNYPSVRHSAEANVREYYRKSQDLRHSNQVEISFAEIFARIGSVYGLSEAQKKLLMEWETQAELENVIPLKPQIALVKKYLAQGQKVVLISDMYLPKETVTELLKKADPVLAELPLFLSNEYGVLKTSQMLYFEVYKSFEPYYDFRKWIHYGDNRNADQTQARKFRISTRHVDKPEFSDVQRAMVKKIGTYDAYLVAAMQTRMYQDSIYEKDSFVCSYVALCLVPYVDWALRDALRRGYETLYFISRDGHHLKRIADVIIEERKLPLKTKYIYASRRTWRIPSYVHEVDEGFWGGYGNFDKVESKDKLYSAMDLDEETFQKLFPTIRAEDINFLDKKEVASYVEIFRNSEAYHDYLLKKAAEGRRLVCGYLEQEIDQSEKFAVVEYWGRGYTQDCMVNLWRTIAGEDAQIAFYYSRSILPTMNGSIRHNFVTNDSKQFFMEAIFANMPYRSVEQYEVKDGKIVPVIVPLRHHEGLFDSMQRCLPEFARQYVHLPLKNPEDMDRLLYEFALEYYNDNMTNPQLAEHIGSLIDSVALYGKKREYAPPYTMEKLDLIQSKELGRGSGLLTTCIPMSVTRSSEEVKKRYYDMYQLEPGENLEEGRLISEESQQENLMYKEKYNRLLHEAEQFAKLYDEAVELCETEKIILFVVAGRSLKNTGLDLVEKILREQTDYQVQALLLGKTDIDEAEQARMLAAAGYILVSKPIEKFCRINWRKETEQILLPKTAFPLYNQGLMASYALRWRKRYQMLAGNNDISVLQVPSGEREGLFRRNYCPGNSTSTIISGCCNTDLYFDEAFLAESKSKLRNFFPEAGERKVILYMPSVRIRNKCEHWLNLLAMDVLQKFVGQEYVVVLHLNTRKSEEGFKNPICIAGFSKEVKKELSMYELLAACDVVVGDYRDTFFESALLDKPVYFTASDYEERIRTANMSQNANSFDEFLFGPVINTAEDLARQLANVESYNYEPMRQFRRRMFAGCDGHSAQRVAEYILQNKK